MQRKDLKGDLIQLKIELLTCIEVVVKGQRDIKNEA